MFNGKLKAVTFSFDDGIEADKRLIEILDKYALKCTFNLNSGQLGKKDSVKRLDWKGDMTCYDCIPKEQIREVYKNHEVAIHSVNHVRYTHLTDKALMEDVQIDKKVLSDLVGYEIVGSAYPCGDNDDRTARVLAESGIRYARTIEDTYGIDWQSDLLRLKPTCHSNDRKVLQIAQDFIEMETDTPKLLYIWGHSFNFDDSENAWQEFEKLCKMLSMKEDIFYGTNKEVLLGM